MNADHIVQFGHSDTDRLVLGNFDIDPDTYSVDADVRAGNFKGAARMYGHVTELVELHASLQQMSKSLSGETTFENLDHPQLNLRCHIDNLGTVHMQVSIRDYGNQIDCSFETDPISLDATIASLAKVIGRARPADH